MYFFISYLYAVYGGVTSLASYNNIYNAEPRSQSPIDKRFRTSDGNLTKPTYFAY